ncbi:helix-turn-helix domain-containing protein [Dictyobacter aurantiacus]|uniref:AraC family transcriptional regulator n=1 Tax=Dictyobacter aurantiacus TaxID=1936993 RepID=A0A401ZJB6_9CHLR|nr:AraC family transcriptional regulator [Dictyobacter aurantiacus]GCE06933.1 AraC family transcriptional regulator [Dictyobacter aurantiacus]
MESLSVKDDSLERTFDVPPEHIIQSSSGKGWNALDIAEVIHPHDDFVLPAIPRHVLVVNLGSPSQIREQYVGRQGLLKTGNLVIMPAGAPSNWHLEREEEVRHLHLYLSPTLIQNIAASADVNPDRVELIDTIGVFDPQIESIALSLLAELRSEGLGGKLYVESLATMLGIQLLRHHSSLQQPSLATSAHLARTTLRPAINYIEEHLAEDLSLSDIAAVVHLSPYHFARLFKESTGLPPHRYVIQRRIERAKLLMTTTNWSFTTIAHAVGFSNESHLALHFKRLTGLAPRTYR